MADDSDFLDSVAANSNPIIFGDFRHCWVVNCAQMSVQILREKYAESNQDAFVTFLRSTAGSPSRRTSGSRRSRRRPTGTSRASTGSCATSLRGRPPQDAGERGPRLPPLCRDTNLDDVIRMLEGCEVVRVPLLAGGVAYILVHNHPSGDPSPSPEDIAITRQVAEAAKLLDLELLDHLIIGHGTWVSMRERRLLTYGHLHARVAGPRGQGLPGALRVLAYLARPGSGHRRTTTNDRALRE